MHETIKPGQGWLEIIGEEFGRPYMAQLQKFLDSERARGAAVYPEADRIFHALNCTPFDNVKVVVIGQDPYHGEGQAHGLCFSVQDGIRLPPSLLNIYKEIEAEYGVKMPRSGDLTGWAQQGVLLLNATLTVEHALAGSHQKRGWEQFTDAVIRAVSDRREHVVFLLWGSYAQKKGAVIDRRRHSVLESAHPSPLSAHRGFLGNGHFKKANEYLAAHGRDMIDWTKVGA